VPRPGLLCRRYFDLTVALFDMAACGMFSTLLDVKNMSVARLSRKEITVLAPLTLLLFLCAAHAQTETVLYNFAGVPDGSYPTSSLTSNGAGTFYGTTSEGGANGEGSVFELVPNGVGGYNEAVIYSFCSVPNCADGELPSYSSVVRDSIGNIYGTTSGGGGLIQYGVVFELSPVGSTWTESVLYSFKAAGDGGEPVNNLIMDKMGNLYGTTFIGGPDGGGTVFELSPKGGSDWTEQVIYATNILSGLTIDTAGNLYGVEGASGGVDIFELSPNGNGSWKPIVLHTFAHGSVDGPIPVGTPLFSHGKLYGTTNYGGTAYAGTVYMLTKGKKHWTAKVLHNFGAGNDGREPLDGITLDSAGNIYGTTLGGGKYDDGIVFELVAPVGEGAYREKILLTFSGEGGIAPYDSLILDGSDLYGTALAGGTNGEGVVFEVTPY
jgi:uncharacterized repeat protein (TIGR03803 family)